MRYAAFADGPGLARQLVHRLAVEGADLIKVALEPGDAGWPVFDPAVLRRDRGRGPRRRPRGRGPCVGRRHGAPRVNAGVDELAHTPTEPLPEELIDTIAGRGISVVSTLQTFFAAGAGRGAAANAAALHRAGVVLRYGTDLGNAGTRPGVDPRELDRLADTGLGRLGALRAATGRRPRPRACADAPA